MNESMDKQINRQTLKNTPERVRGPNLHKSLKSGPYKSVYGPWIGFLGHFNPCWCKTFSCTTISRVAYSLQYAHL
jgi:hypothetical protein